MKGFTVVSANTLPTEESYECYEKKIFLLRFLLAYMQGCICDCFGVFLGKISSETVTSFSQQCNSSLLAVADFVVFFIC